MGYTLSLHLKEGAPIDASPSDYGVYISYSSLMTVESYLIHALIHSSSGCPEQYQYKMYNDVIKKRYVVPTEPEDDRQYAYFEASKYNESRDILTAINYRGFPQKILKWIILEWD